MIVVRINKPAYKSHKKSGTLERYRGNLIGALIHQRYDINDQIAIAMDKDDKPTEFAEYQAYRAECKATVDKWFAEMEK